MTPQDFSDDVCRCGCQDDGPRLQAIGKRAEAHLASLSPAKRRFLERITAQRPAVQPEERGGEK